MGNPSLFIPCFIGRILTPIHTHHSSSHQLLISDIDKPATNYETWFIAGGAEFAALYEFRQPGFYAYVNHNLIEAIMFGPTTHVIVGSEWNHDLMT